MRINRQMGETMKKQLLFVILMFLLSPCGSVGQPATPTQPLPTDASPPPQPLPTDASPPPPTQPLPTDTSLPPSSIPPTATPDPTAGWLQYSNPQIGYALKYPAECSFGPLPGYCKQGPPEERPPECLCFLNGDDPFEVWFQSFVGDPAEGLTLVTLTIVSYDTPEYNPPAGTDLGSWLATHFSFLSGDIPTEPNAFLGGLPAVSIYKPGSPQAYAAEELFVIKDGRLIRITMVDVDVQEHRDLYDLILSTFTFLN
jgi:hypothetical protein